MPLVSIHIVTHNSAETIDACLDAVFNQSCSDFSVMIVDNNSHDDSVQRVSRRHDSRLSLIVNPDNQYYSRAHNTAITHTDSEFVLTVNPDVIMYPDYVARVLHAFTLSPRIGSINGKLLLIEQRELRPELLTRPPASNAIIDGAGLMMYKSRRPYLRGNRKRHGSYCLRPEHIFGVDGACGAYRRSTLEDVAIEGEYFDNDFVMYREDVDLAWRAKLFGWDSFYVPNAIGYHARGFQLGRGRRAILPSLRRHSVKNGWLLIVKNDCLPSLTGSSPWILPYQSKIAAGLITIEHSSVPAIPQTVALLPTMMRKRREIQARRTRSETEMKLWFE